MINAQAYHDTSLSNLLLTEKCSTGLSVNYFFVDYARASHDLTNVIYRGVAGKEKGGQGRVPFSLPATTR